MTAGFSLPLDRTWMADLEPNPVAAEPSYRPHLPFTKEPMCVLLDSGDTGATNIIGCLVK
jgi:hypothetical protein